MAISRLSDASIQDGLPKFDNLWDGFTAVGSMEPISAITLSTSSDSVTFNNIPGTYSHLQLRLLARTSRAEIDDGFEIQLNGDTGTNYRYHYLNGSGSTTFAYTEGSMTGLVAPVVAGASAGASIFGAVIMDILDYSNTNKYTTTRASGGIDNNGSGAVRTQSGLWLNTAAVTSMKIQSNALGDFVTNSSFSLYGIK